MRMFTTTHYHNNMDTLLLLLSCEGKKHGMIIEVNAYTCKKYALFITNEMNKCHSLF